jgi:hypothetical protein
MDTQPTAATYRADLMRGLVVRETGPGISPRLIPAAWAELRRMRREAATPTPDTAA